MYAKIIGRLESGFNMQSELFTTPTKELNEAIARELLAANEAEDKTKEIIDEFTRRCDSERVRDSMPQDNGNIQV